MKLTFLGTSAGQPSLNRNTTSIALHFENGELILIDCGEATLIQFMRSPLKFSRINTIFITHLHGDHIFGLPGLLCTLNSQRIEPLNIYGPRGIKRFCSVFDQTIKNFPLIIHEITGECLEVCNISILNSIIQVNACHIYHSIECYAYSFTETKIKNKIDMSKVQPFIDLYSTEIINLGFNPPKKIIKEIVSDLYFTVDFINSKNGNLVTLNAKDFVVNSKPIKLVIALDNYKCSNLFTYFKWCDVLVHESTYISTKKCTKEDRENTLSQALTNKHSTNLMAAKNATKIGAKKLILTHFSNRYKLEDGKMIDELEILEACKDEGFDGEISIAYDFSEFIV